jgi:hypothetical protein
MTALFIAIVAVVLLGLLCCCELSGNCERQEEAELQRKEQAQQEKATNENFTADPQQMAAAMREAVIKAGLKGGD